MASYTRLGSYLLANELALDPFGKVHRGLTNLGSAFDRHMLIRTFSGEIEDSGFGTKLADANRVLPLLGSTRGFGTGYRIEAGKTPYVVCDYIPGRNLAQLLEKAKQEQIPLGVDHALTVLQSVAQSIIHMHAKGLSHGVLTPHSVWVSFEGATHLLDAPYASILKGMLHKMKVAEVSISRYTRDTGGNVLHQDFFALGAILYELLTLDKLPAPNEIAGTLSRATLKAAQDDDPIPSEILGLLNRLLMVTQPFEDVNAFNTELESVLYDGDYSPTTFNMAFFMHTLFREENEQDTQSMKADQTADFTPFVMMDAGVGAGGSINEVQKKSLVKFAVWGGALTAGLLGTMGYVTWRANQRSVTLQKDLIAIQTQYYNDKANLANLDKQSEDVKSKLSEKEKASKEAKTKAERDKLLKDAEDLRAEQARIDADKKATQDRIDKGQEKAKALQESAKNAKLPAILSLPASNPPASTPANVPATVGGPVPGQPSPVASTPVATTPTRTVPQPAPTPAMKTPEPTPQPASTPGVQAQPAIPDTPVKVLEPSNPAYPAAARRDADVAGKDNTVKLRVFVDETGKPLRVLIAEGIPGPYGFDDSAKDAALRTRFEPATKGGKPVKDWIVLSVRFPKVK